MRRLGRSVLGAVGGLLWGAGGAVLVQQYGLWPLDPLLAYGAPLAAALAGMEWARRGSRRVRRTAVLAVLVAVPLGTVGAQPVCDVLLSTPSASVLLADTTPADPFPVDPGEGPVEVIVTADGAGRTGEVWIELGGVPVHTRTGTVDGVLIATLDPHDDDLGALAGTPGTYHVGGSIDGVCSAAGYIRISGNPLTGPVGQAAVAAVGLGLLLTWLAGRPGAVAAPARLRPDGRPVRFDGVVIRSPGLAGSVEVHRPTPAALRAVAGWTAETHEALARQHMSAERVVQITDSAETAPALDAAGVVTRHGDAAFQVEMPPPPEGHGQVVLAGDESGVVSWNLPRLVDGAVDAAPHDGPCRYLLPRWVAPVEAALGRRGLVTAVAGKVVTSVAFPLLDPVFGAVGERFAAAWEARRRPYRFRTFSPDDYRSATATEPDWERIAGGRSLLFVHGTFSRADTAFGSMPGDVLAELHRRYDGRVFAFDHHTLSDDPRVNVEWFLDHLPEGMQLDVDIVCHSRGGLVSRVLGEQTDESTSRGRRVEVGSVVFVASPNAGTILAEPTYLGDLVDGYANILNFLPGPYVVDLLEGLITVVKHVAVGALAGLDGLQAMRPGGEFLRRLNSGTPPPGRYHAVTADYEPRLAGWRQLAVNRIADGIFGEPNDLVVPTAGTYAGNGSTRFPIVDRYELRSSDGVDHTGYFADPQVGAHLLGWLDPTRG